MGNDEATLPRLWRKKHGEVGPEDLSANLLVQPMDWRPRSLRLTAGLPQSSVSSAMSCQNAGKTQKFMPVRESSGEYRLIHVKGWAAPETKAAVEQARLLLEQAETVGETPEDPLLLFSVLFWRCVLARTR